MDKRLSKPRFEKKDLNSFVYIWITDRVVKFTRIIQLRRDFSEHEINRSGSKTFSHNITLLCAEEAASQSMNVVLQKKSRAVDCPVGSNRNTTRSFILVINLQFFTCGHAKFRFSISLHPTSSWTYNCCDLSPSGHAGRTREEVQRAHAELGH